MDRYVGVKFQEYGQIYFFRTHRGDMGRGDKVVVVTEEGVGLGEVVVIRKSPPRDIPPEEIKVIERKATSEDLAQEEENRRLSKEAFDFCKKNIEKLGLDMKLVDVEVRFDRSKMIFYFTAPMRVDFRELVKILVRRYHTRIELRQIGVRHEAQMVGGIGNCGRICCCRLFLRRFEPVTIKMAKEQQLFLNPSKISGTCGRLLCCLNFEKEIYTDFHRRCPRIGKKYETRLGEVRILRANIFRDSIVVDTGLGVEREISLVEWLELLEGKGDLRDYEYLFSSRLGMEGKFSAVVMEHGLENEDLEDLKRLMEEEEGQCGVEEVSSSSPAPSKREVRRRRRNRRKTERLNNKKGARGE